MIYARIYRDDPSPSGVSLPSGYYEYVEYFDSKTFKEIDFDDIYCYENELYTKKELEKILDNGEDIEEYKATEDEVERYAIWED